MRIAGGRRSMTVILMGLSTVTVMTMWLCDVDEKDYNEDKKDDGEDKDKYHKDDNDDDGAEATVIAMRFVGRWRQWRQRDEKDDNNDRNGDDEDEGEYDQDLYIIGAVCHKSHYFTVSPKSAYK